MKTSLCHQHCFQHSEVQNIDPKLTRSQPNLGKSVVNSRELSRYNYKKQRSNQGQNTYKMSHISTLDKGKSLSNFGESIDLFYSDHTRSLVWFSQIESSPLSTTVSEVNPHWDANTTAVSAISDLHLTLPICKAQTISCLNYWAFTLLSPLPETASSSDSPSSSFIPFLLDRLNQNVLVLLCTQSLWEALESWKMTELPVWGKTLCWNMIVCLPVGPVPLMSSSFRGSVIIWRSQGQLPAPKGQTEVVQWV